MPAYGGYLRAKNIKCSTLWDDDWDHTLVIDSNLLFSGIPISRNLDRIFVPASPEWGIYYFWRFC